MPFCNLLYVPKSLGEVLKAARLRSGLSQSAVARHAGMDASQISKLEADERGDARFSTIAALSDVLGISMDVVAAECGLRTKMTRASLEGRGPESAHLAEVLSAADRTLDRAHAQLKKAQAIAKAQERRGRR